MHHNGDNGHQGLSTSSWLFLISCLCTDALLVQCGHRAHCARKCMLNAMTSLLLIMMSMLDNTHMRIRAMFPS